MAEICAHPVMMRNMCAVCGKIIELNASSTLSALTLQGGNTVRITGNEANKIQQGKTTTLRKHRKLALVLDIDNTLVHATHADGSTPSITVQDDGEIHHLPLEEQSRGMVRHLVIKKRPHVDYFLAQAQELFQMTIYTAGTKRYAEAVARVIDPTKVYIGNRIVARNDENSGEPVVLEKSLSKIFLNDASMAVILDDREDVWRGPQSEQLCLVRPYEYFFPGNAGSLAVKAFTDGQPVNNAPGHVTNKNNARPVPVISLHAPHPGALLSVAPMASAEYTEADDQLLRSLHVLKTLHSEYYARLDAIPLPHNDESRLPSVAEILRNLRRQVLAGCVVCLAISADQQHSGSAQSVFLHNMRRLCESLGASASYELTARTTHVVAVSLGSQQVQMALQTRAQDVWVLHVDWLHHCRWALQRCDERTFMLKPPPAGTPLPNPVLNTQPPPPPASLSAPNPAPREKRPREDVQTEVVSTDSVVAPTAVKRVRVNGKVHSDEVVNAGAVVSSYEDVGRDADAVAEAGAVDQSVVSRKADAGHVVTDYDAEQEDEYAVGEDEVQDFDRDSGAPCCLAVGDDDEEIEKDNQHEEVFESDEEDSELSFSPTHNRLLLQHMQSEDSDSEGFSGLASALRDRARCSQEDLTAIPISPSPHHDMDEEEEGGDEDLYFHAE